MSKLKDLENRREKYFVLLDDINNLKDSLLSVKGNLEEASTIGDYFSIDNISADNNEILDIKDDLSVTIDYLTEKVITTINSKISRLNREINRLPKEDLDEGDE